MPKICYTPERRFTRQWLKMIAIANTILEEYQEQGFKLTLRQLYYQIVARNLFPEDRKWVRHGGKWVKNADGTKNADPNYNWIGVIINDARLAGLVDWNHLVDRTRNLKDLEHFNGAEDALAKLAGWYHVDMWENQKVRPEVWIEKDALTGVIEGVCQQLDVPFFSCRGYTSQSEMWRAGQRLAHWHDLGYTTHIIHLGDHDPSGIDMSRDIFDRMEMFMGGTEFERIALNMDQVRLYDPPPDPAKITDSRCKAYIERFGGESWELDALEPSVMNDLITNAVIALRDEGVYKEDQAHKNKVKDKLYTLADNWNIPIDRYDITACHGSELDVEEMDNGEWVRHEDITHLQDNE